MIHYHGTPITPESCALKTLQGRHAFISFAETRNLQMASEVCQSFALDNGAFSFWRSQRTPEWDRYYDFVRAWMHHPRFDFAIAPDVIEGGEEANDELLAAIPNDVARAMAPVWHMDESPERLEVLAARYNRVAIGSCAEYDVTRPAACVARLKSCLQVICDDAGYPRVKLHGLRMLNSKIFEHIPLSSADSTNLARSIGLDHQWTGTYTPKSKETRAMVLAERIESAVSASSLYTTTTETEITECNLSFTF